MIKPINLIRKSKKKTFSMIPNLFTFLNAFFGFVSILQSLDNNFKLASYFILLSALMDNFDGRIARLLGVASEFGTELDSLADVISFCLAPAVLLYSALLDDFGNIGILLAGIYLLAGVFRLAKFNISHNLQKKYFIGIPSTVAALFISSLVLYETRISLGSLKFLLTNHFLALIVLFIAFLMVSPLRFPSFKGSSLKNKFLMKILFILFLSFICIINSFPIMFFFLLGYILLGLLFNFYLFIRWILISRFYNS